MMFSELLAWRIAPLALVSAALLGCGNTPPASSANDVDNSSPPPASSSAAATEGPATTPAAATSIAGDVQADSKRNKFDEEQAKIVLARAATNAHSCVEVVDKSQPHGDGTVTVTFSGKGKTTKASIAAPFEGTPIGQCATRAFVDMIVPPFEGADVEMTYQINLKPDAKAAKKESAKPKK